jgi:hypothetical protein
VRLQRAQGGLCLEEDTMTSRPLRFLLAAAAAMVAATASAEYHTFRIEQIFSSADGTIQFVVLHESLGMNGESLWSGHTLTSTQGATTNTYIFPRDLPGGSCGYYGCTPSPTADHRVLVGTASFAALGLVQPNFTVPDGFILPAGTLNYANVDMINYTSLPTDGVSAMDRSGASVPAVATNFAGQSAPVVTAAAAANYQGLWWNSPANSESGWGLNLAHQGDTIFASWFTYNTSGKGWWLVVTLAKTGPNTYSGDLYTTTGARFDAFNPANVVATKAGTATLTFTDANNGTFNYVVGAVNQTKNITREVFGPMPTCSFGTVADLTTATNYQDLWWNKPANSESGWGINLNHEGDTIFATWFTYDLDGTPLWLVVTANNTGPGVYSGDLFRTSGAHFDAFNPANVVATKVGSATFTFADGNDATFDYTVQLSGMAAPVHQQKQITREIFTAPGTTCH